MSSEPLIRARGLGKFYDLFASPGQRLAHRVAGGRSSRRHWALRNFDLEVGRGRCVGVIGRNGSGKSTLLSLLAGITQPDEGSLLVQGRVAALLELGAGFDRDFSGRDNAMLAGAIYGLSEAQMAERLDAIERFAEIGDFIDRPVREYSSGMFARLAFAVASHVDADILIVDEILGVGDFRFQQRCANFIRSFKTQGLVLLVSHDERTILNLCDEAVWLHAGTVRARGKPREVAHAYHASTAQEAGPKGSTFASSGQVLSRDLAADGSASAKAEALDLDRLPEADGRAHIRRCALRHGSTPLESAKGGEQLVVEVEAELGRGALYPIVTMAIRDSIGVLVVGADSSEFGDPVETAGQSRIMGDFAFQLPFLPSGGYTLDVALVARTPEGFDCLARSPEAATFQVLSRHPPGGMANVPLLRAEILHDGEVLVP